MEHPPDGPRPKPPTAEKGRGAVVSPKNRFEVLEYTPTYDTDDTGEHSARPAGRTPTVFYKDLSRSIISTNNSPDIPFDASINPYRGCEHGCVYCYARPTHEYLGFNAGMDFESKIMVKADAADLLRKQLTSRRWKPQLLAISGVTDAYQPIERRLEITRQCLQVLADFRNPVGVITKNYLVTRDADLLGELAACNAANVMISITSLDPDLTRIMEPRTSTPQRRLDAIRLLAEAGVPVGVFISPVIPALNDHEIPALLEAAAEVGATCARFTLLRLPGAVAPMFESWLDAHYPDRRQKVVDRIRGTRHGKLNESFGNRMRGTGVFAKQIHDLFELHRKRLGLSDAPPALSAAAFRRPDDDTTGAGADDGRMRLF